MIKEFLEHIWPDKGFYCVAVPEEKTDGSGYYYKQRVFNNIPSTIGYAESVDAAGKDCYMAVGTLKERSVLNEQTGKHQVRVHENMGWFKALIFDIDCGEDKPYKTQAEALTALGKFYKDTGLPAPSVISSGGGLHVYFTFNQAIPADVWFKFAIRLKAVARHFELHVDDSRTSDKSSVLRVAGTHNYKKETPRPVRALKLAPHTSVADMKKALDRVINHENIEIETPKEVKKRELNETEKLFAQLGVKANITDEVFSGDKSDGELVRQRCNTMKMVHELHGDCREPVWGGALQLDMHCKDPIPVELSNGYSGYNQAEMQAKLDRFAQQGIGPTTCAKFREDTREYGWCDGCPYDVKSPIVLGMSWFDKETRSPKFNPELGQDALESVPDEALDEETEEVTDTTSAAFGAGESDQETFTVESDYGFNIPIPTPPSGYSIRDDGLYVQSEDENGGEAIIRFSPYKIYPYETQAEKIDGGEFVVKVAIHLPHGNVRKITTPFNNFTESKVCAKMFANAGVIIPSNQDFNTLQMYMKRYILELQRLTKTVHKYHQLGWHEDGDIFVLPEETLHIDGTKETSGVVSGIAQAVKGFRKKGTLEAWKEVINTYNRPGMEHYAFGHLVGYGSLLFHFQEYDGAIVNLVGDTGSGKTMVLKTINTMFGHPTEFMLTQSDTVLARMAHLGVFNSICATYDEITNIEAQELSDFCYAISQGRGRHRLNQNAEMKENHTKWKMILASSSNKSLLSELSTLKHDSSAEAMRVFEYFINREHTMSITESKKIFEPLSHNYGHAGEIFLNYVVNHTEEVRKMLIDNTTHFDEVAEVPINERYWSAVVGCVITGGMIAKKLNLCDYNMERIFNWAVEQVKIMRGIVTENVKDPIAIIDEFLRENTINTLVVSEVAGARNGIYVDQAPRHKLFVRYDKTNMQAYIAKSVIRSWIIKGGGDYNYVKNSLKDAGILLHDNKYKTLSSGWTDGPPSGQARCWLVDMDHPEMTGTIRTLATRNTATVVAMDEGLDKEENG